MNNVLQSGVVTPGHIASWTTDGVIQDSGLTLVNTYGIMASTVTGINFNAIADNPILISLPSGYTRYRIHGIVISGASGTLSTATCGVFTATGAGGFAVVTSGTAITVTSSAADTNNNAQNLTIVDQNTIAFSDATLYFRVQNAQGVAATGNVSIFYQPMP